MGFLKFVAKRRLDIDPENMDFTDEDKSESTLRQYDSAFRKLTYYLRLYRPKEMSINVALSFFRHLHNSGLAASMVTSTKSTLAIARSCAKQRPTSNLDMLSWSLNNVLRLASAIQNSSCTYQQTFM